MFVVLRCAAPCCAVQGIKPDRQREVLQYYQYSADRGNVDAQTAVGTLLNIGTHGVVRDHEAAAHYLQRAAASGSAEAMAHLGHMHGSGMGVPLVSCPAVKTPFLLVGFEVVVWLSSCGLRWGVGMVPAQPVHTGHHVPQLPGRQRDYQLVKWCGSKTACAACAVLLLQNHAEALRYFRKAADKNNALGLYGLGYMYLSGTAVTQDYDMAFKKLQAAADAGDRDAHFYLGSMYYNVRAEKAGKQQSGTELVVCINLIHGIPVGVVGCCCWRSSWETACTWTSAASSNIRRKRLCCRLQY